MSEVEILTDLMVDQPGGVASVTSVANRVKTTGGGLEAVSIIGTAGTAQTLDLAVANVFDLTLSSSNCTLTLSGATAAKACTMSLIVRQGGTGGRTITWPGSVTWLSGSAPSLKTTNGGVDRISLISVDGGTNWLGSISGAQIQTGTTAGTVAAGDDTRIVNALSQQQAKVAFWVSLLAPQFGAKGDVRTAADAAMTSGSSTITSMTLASNATVGQIIETFGTGISSGAQSGTITAVNAGLNQVTVSYTANTTVASSLSVRWGTDDSAAVTAWQAAGGNWVPAGTFYSGKMTLVSGLHIYGAGSSMSTMILKPGTNDNLVETANFATLTGTDTSATPNNCGIHKITLDANYQTNTTATSTTGHGVALYGYSIKMFDVTIRYARNALIWSEWSSASPFLLPDGMENSFAHIKAHDCLGMAGFKMIGAHDTHVHDMFLVRPCANQAGSKALDIPMDGRANGSAFSMLHIYGGTFDIGIYCKSAGVRFDGSIQVEGATVIEMYVDAAQVSVLDFKFFTGGVNTAGVKGLVMGSSGNLLSGLSVHGRIENCGGGALDYTYMGDHNVLSVHIFDYASQVPTNYVAAIGTPAKNNDVSVYHSDKTFTPTSYCIHRKRGTMRMQPATDGDWAWRALQNSDTQSSNLAEFQKSDGSQLSVFDARGRYRGGNAAVPSIAAAAGAGTAPTMPTPSSSIMRDTEGTVTFTVGTSPAAGDQFTVTFSAAYASNAPKIVVCADAGGASPTPTSLRSAQAVPYISARSTTSFTVAFVNAPTAGAVYSVAYVMHAG